MSVGRMIRGFLSIRGTRCGHSQRPEEPERGSTEEETQLPLWRVRTDIRLPTAALGDQAAALGHRQAVGKGHGRLLRCSKGSRKSQEPWLRATRDRVDLLGLTPFP